MHLLQASVLRAQWELDFYDLLRLMHACWIAAGGRLDDLSHVQQALLKPVD